MRKWGSSRICNLATVSAGKHYSSVELKSCIFVSKPHSFPKMSCILSAQEWRKTNGSLGIHMTHCFWRIRSPGIPGFSFTHPYVEHSALRTPALYLLRGTAQLPNSDPCVITHSAFLFERCVFSVPSNVQLQQTFNLRGCRNRLNFFLLMSFSDPLCI